VDGVHVCGYTDGDRQAAAFGHHRYGATHRGDPSAGMPLLSATNKLIGVLVHAMPYPNRFTFPPLISADLRGRIHSFASVFVSEKRHTHTPLGLTACGAHRSSGIGPLMGRVFCVGHAGRGSRLAGLILPDPECSTFSCSRRPHSPSPCSVFGTVLIV